jgi:hypothetical protein
MRESHAVVREAAPRGAACSAPRVGPLRSWRSAEVARTRACLAHALFAGSLGAMKRSVQICAMDPCLSQRGGARRKRAVPGEVPANIRLVKGNPNVIARPQQ